MGSIERRHRIMITLFVIVIVVTLTAFVIVIVIYDFVSRRWNCQIFHFTENQRILMEIH